MKKILSVLIAVALMLCGSSLLAGCRKKVPDSETDIQIAFWKSGFGDEYMKETVKAFKKKYPQYNVIFESTTDGSVYANTIAQSGSNSIDLYCTSVIDLPYNEKALPLNDILTSTCEGESVTIGEKLIPEVKEGLQWADGNYYGLSYSGSLEGIVYNADIIDGEKYEVPRTTTELVTLVTDLTGDAALKDKTAPFIHYAAGGYWNRVYKTWQAQYDGLDYYYKTFMALKDEQGVSPSKDVLIREDGRKQAFEVLDSIIRANTVTDGSNALEYNDAQTMFMNGYAAMMVTGNWLVNEMKSNSEATDTNLKMMKTPIISSIKDNLPNVENDYQLRDVIDAVDAFDDGAAKQLAFNDFTITDAEWDRVYEARHVMSSNFDGHLFVIPEYSNATEAAKEFVKFCYSDEAIRIFSQYTHSMHPARLSTGSLDTTGWLDFELTAKALTEKAVPLLQEAAPYRSVLFTKGALRPFGKTEPIGALSVEKGRSNAGKLWSGAVSYYNSNWSDFLSNAGLQ